jgi:ribosomal protein S16
MLILDLKNFIFWIKKGAAISGNFNKILKKASKSLQNNKKIAINIKY